MSADQGAVAKDEAALSQALSQGSSSTPARRARAPAPALALAPARVRVPAPAPAPGPVPHPDAEGRDVHDVGSSWTSGNDRHRRLGRSGRTSGRTSQSSDTPQQIAADQAAIDTAQAELTVAEQSLTEANLTSPIDGTIVSVGISVGDTVSANSSTAVIVIIGTQSFEVSGTLSSAQVASVKVGDSADVQVDGLDGTIDGTVSQVGPVQSGTSGYTYPVVVALPSTATGLFAGSTANVVIATGAVSHVVAVPTSAVQSFGTRSYVEMLSSGTLTRKVIKVGMVGDTYTQVLSGLTAGPERGPGRLRRAGPLFEYEHLRRLRGWRIRRRWLRGRRCLQEPAHHSRGRRRGLRERLSTTIGDGCAGRWYRAPGSPSAGAPEGPRILETGGNDMATDRGDPASLVDLERYPLLHPGSAAYRACVADARRQLRDKGAAELPGFVSPAGVAELVRDADALAPRAHPSAGQGTAYLEFPDFSLPPDHPRLHFADYAVRAVAYDITPVRLAPAPLVRMGPPHRPDRGRARSRADLPLRGSVRRAQPGGDGRG